ALGAWTDPSTWQELLQKSVPLGDAVVTLVDREGSALVRLGGPPIALGQRLPPPPGKPASGLARDEENADGATYSAWRSMPSSGWRLRVDLPAAPVDTMVREAIVSTAIGAA